MTGSGLQQAILFALSVGGLWLGARAFVDTASSLARRIGLSELAVGLTVVAVGTSSPELVVSVDAALTGRGDIAVANVVGSNIYNVAVVLGVSALFGGFAVDRELLRRDGAALAASSLLLVAVLWDLHLSRVEGGVFLVLLVGYTGYLLRTAETDAQTGPAPPFGGREALALGAGLGVVLVSGHFLVESASALARLAGVSEWVIGETVVAAGTSTPEFAVSVVAVRRGSVGVSVGNVLGSNVFNALGVLGLAATLRPLSVAGSAVDALGWLVAVVSLALAALWTGSRLSRPEGGLFALSEVVRWTLELVG